MLGEQSTEPKEGRPSNQHRIVDVSSRAAGSAAAQLFHFVERAWPVFSHQAR